MMQRGPYYIEVQMNIEEFDLADIEYMLTRLPQETTRAQILQFLSLELQYS